METLRRTQYSGRPSLIMGWNILIFDNELEHFWIPNDIRMKPMHWLALEDIVKESFVIFFKMLALASEFHEWTSKAVYIKSPCHCLTISWKHLFSIKKILKLFIALLLVANMNIYCSDGQNELVANYLPSSIYYSMGILTNYYASFILLVYF